MKHITNKRNQTSHRNNLISVTDIQSNQAAYSLWLSQSRPSYRHGFVAGGIVQRLIKDSELLTGRDDVPPEIQEIAGHIKEYHELSAGKCDAMGTVDDIIDKLNHIEALISQCQGEHDWDRLGSQITEERGLLIYIGKRIREIQAEVSDDCYDCKSALSVSEQGNEIRQRYLADFIREHLNSATDEKSDYFKNIREWSNCVNSQVCENEINIFAGYFRSDFARMRQDETVPLELRMVLDEVLREAGTIPLVGVSGNQTTFYKPGKGPGGPVGIEIEARNRSTDEMESSYLHEMTHAAVHAAYQNTPISLNVPATADKKIYKKMFVKRNNFALKLRQAIQMEESGKDNSGFTSPQLRLLREKTDYGMFNDKTVLAYIPRFVRFNETDAESQGIEMGQAVDLLQKLQYAMGGTLRPDIRPLINENRIMELLQFFKIKCGIPMNKDPDAKEYFSPKDLTKLGLKKDKKLASVDWADEERGKSAGSAIFVEYDTTINQMLFLCYKWGIPQENQVVSLLRMMVRDALDDRNTARTLLSGGGK